MPWDGLQHLEQPLNLVLPHCLLVHTYEFLMKDDESDVRVSYFNRVFSLLNISARVFSLLSPKALQGRSAVLFWSLHVVLSGFSSDEGWGKGR